MRKWLVLACVFTVGGASAQTPAPPVHDGQIESVTVAGSSLIGIWKLAWPQWGRLSPFGGGANWGAMSDRFCRIEPSRGDLAIRCFGGQGQFAAGTASLEGAKIHFAWAA